jgi:hypothetical protein
MTRGAILISAAPRGAIGNNLFNIKRRRFHERSLLARSQRKG